MSITANGSSLHYTFLLDASTARQYALIYKGRELDRILMLSNSDPDLEEPPIVPMRGGENVVAFDDQYWIEMEGTGSVLKAQVYQIHTDSLARLRMRTAEVVYRIEFGGNGNGIPFASYAITDESLANLQAAGIDLPFPESYGVAPEPERKSDPEETPGNPLLFPPHHKEGAEMFKARVALEWMMELNDEGPCCGSSRVEHKPPVSHLTSPASCSTSANRNAPAPYRVGDPEIDTVLKEFATDLTRLARENLLDPVIGRDKETEQAIKALMRRKRSCIAFTGPGGVGKTAMFSAVARALVFHPRLPASLQNARVLAIDVQAMVAGAKYMGEFEGRIKPLIDGLTEREGIFRGQKIILAMDEIHAQLSTGATENAAYTGNLMKPFLVSRGISVMGATTSEEYRRTIEKDSALARRFESVRIDPPNHEMTKAILNRLWPLIKEHNGIEKDISDDDLDYVISMTNRYAPQQVQPDKAEAALNMAAASAEYRGSKNIEREDIIVAMAQMSGLSLDFLNRSEDEKILALEERLMAEVLGQPEIRRIVDGIIGSKSGLTDERQPLGCFVLQGPTGTGKTETARAIARHLFGSEEALIRIDMSQFREPHTVSRLIGAPPGYLGFDTMEPALTERVRQKPYSVVLLDEVEKAHPDVFHVLLPVLNDGRMKDNQGRMALFNNVLFIVTTNLGADAAARLIESHRDSDSLSGTEGDLSRLQEPLEEIYREARCGFFSPEMINRISELGGFITFRPLSREIVKDLARREIEKINGRLLCNANGNMKGLKIMVTERVLDQISERGYDPTMGARPLRGLIRERISNPLGKWLMGKREEIEEFIRTNGPARIEIHNADHLDPHLIPYAKSEHGYG